MNNQQSPDIDLQYPQINKNRELPPVPMQQPMQQSQYPQPPISHTQIPTYNYNQYSNPDTEYPMNDNTQYSNPMYNQQIYNSQMTLPDQTEDEFNQTKNNYPNLQNNYNENNVTNNSSLGIQSNDERIKNLKQEIKVLDEIEKNDNLKIKQRRNYCCPNTRRGKWICGISVFVIVALIAIFLGFYFPRVPDFNIQGVNAIPESFKLQGTTVTMSLNANVSVYNENRYNLRVEQIRFTASVSVPAGFGKNGNQTFEIATGTFNNAFFRASGSTLLNFIVNVNYTASQGVNDPLAAAIGSVCSPEARKMKITLKLLYNTQVTMNGLTQLGINPSFNQIGNLQCPFPIEQYENAIQQLSRQ